MTNNPKNVLLKTMPDIKGRYIVIDTETTGVDVKIDNLINISAIEIVDGKITGAQFNGYVRSRDYKCNQHFMTKNRFYYVEDYSKEIYEIEKHTLQNFLNFVGDSIIFAHNSKFDEKFIDRELRKWGLPIIPPENYRCTMMIAKNLLKNKIKEINKNCTLESICRFFNFKYISNDFHHGLFDAFMCARIVCNFFKIIKEDEIKKFYDANINLLNDTNPVQINENPQDKTIFIENSSLMLKKLKEKFNNLHREFNNRENELKQSIEQANIEYKNYPTDVDIHDINNSHEIDDLIADFSTIKVGIDIEEKFSYKDRIFFKKENLTSSNNKPYEHMKTFKNNAKMKNLMRDFCFKNNN